MVKDTVTGECFRADHLLEEHLERLMADPKCPPEKTSEYDEVIKQVRNDAEDLPDIVKLVTFDL